MPDTPTVALRSVALVLPSVTVTLGLELPLDNEVLDGRQIVDDAASCLVDDTGADLSAVAGAVMQLLVDGEDCDF